MNTAEPFSGWLYKWTNLIKGYKKRWFLIQDNLLSYYREPDAIGRHCRGTFNLTNAYLSVQNSGSSFSLTESCGRKHHFKALSEEEKEKWIAVLTESISRSQGPHTGRSKLDLKTTSFPALPQQFTDQSLSLSSYPCSGQLCPHDHLSNSGFNEKSRRTKQDLSRSNNRFTASAPLSNSFSLPTCEPNISTYDLKTKADTGRRLSRQQHVISIEDSNRLETIESIKKRLQDHINNICFQVSNIESMLTSVSTDLSSLLHHSRSLPLNLNDQLFVSDLDRRTTSLKLALLEHRSDAKDFYETSTEALQLLTGTYTRFSRQLTLEQERCITLERTVEQLAKELRSLEIQLRNHIPVVAEKKNINEIQLEGISLSIISLNVGTPSSLYFFFDLLQ
ncbi:Oxysterol-binding protein 1 [Schistosoma japonicum]|nr:Oxysterol-binding protein 1 [Schistosoma japonicum]